MPRQASTPEWITTCNQGPAWLSRDLAPADAPVLCLVIAWSAAEPGRLGEVAMPDERASPLILGRGGATAGDPAERLCFFRQRPGTIQPADPLRGEGMSRRQCVVRPTPSGFEIERVGRCPVLIDGQPVNSGVVRPGQTLTVRDQLVLYATRRAAWSPQRYFEPSRSGGFGRPDHFGIVGESPGAWELREQLAFAAASDTHVLVLGESGAGKELAARALHQMSTRSGRTLIARNAATFPSTLVDAELFGTAANYPNAGVSARPGVIGQAHGSMLFLDEIAELPTELQAHLLRVLDRGGEYQTLGDARVRHSDFRLLAATNRDLTELRVDLAARFAVHIQVPGLVDRPEDIPLLVRHLLVEATRCAPALHARFFQDTPSGPEPRVDPDLVEALLRHRYTYHVRELEKLLWKAVSGSTREYLALTQEVRRMLAPPPLPELQPAQPLPAMESLSAADLPREPTAAEVLDCLARNRSHVTRAARELGLRSRYALYRLMRKHGIVLERAY